MLRLIENIVIIVAFAIAIRFLFGLFMKKSSGENKSCSSCSTGACSSCPTALNPNGK